MRACEPRTRRDGTPLLQARPSATAAGGVAVIVRDPGTELRELCQVGRRSTCAGATSVHPRFGAQIELGALSEAAPGSFAFADLVDGPPHSAETMELEVRDLVATVQDPHLHALLDRLLGPQSPTWELYRARAGGEALPPGLRARPARALPHRRPGRQRDGLDLPRHRSRRGGHRRAAARHRQARRLHRRSRGHRPDRRRQAAGRDPAGLLPHPPRHRGPARASRRRRPRRCCTSSSATTARSSTAAPWSRARARRGSCT